ncbi:MAG: hypothetical protein BMS9Abin26_0257 [Gammaproteobacteria bacterium]|nr:MAG: hypothetical protein BMS9Abin26_0257 [Gammaproteobacteria bacterium]
MNEQRLSEHLSQYYNSKRLSSETLARLTAMVESSSTGVDRKMKAPPTAWRLWPRIWTSGGLLATTLILLIAFIGVFSLGRMIGEGPGPGLTGASLTEAIAKEIARNHHKQEKVQFAVRSYAELRKKMPRLNFPTIASARVDPKRLRLLGGRYCSIRGQIANQIKLRDEKGRIHTLYETRASDAVAGFTEGELQIDGLRISIWRESGLLFGLASPQD